MSPVIRWAGAGEPILFFPGWNTAAETVLSWMPGPFLSRFRCGVVEWPGLGCDAGSELPEDLNLFLDDLQDGLPSRPMPAIGFCMGGVAAWALAQRHPGRVRFTVLVDSPFHFPAVLSPLLVPGLGPAALLLAQGTALGRRIVCRAILQSGFGYPGSFVEELFRFDRTAAIGYVRLLWNYGQALRGPYTARRPCWHLTGRAPVRALSVPLGLRHPVEATRIDVEGAGHFPAVEAPGPFFDCLAKLASGDCEVGLEGESRTESGRIPARQTTLAPSPSPSAPSAWR
jgi:pimeloyl-ACP methyl ester carboxylesterase